MEIRERIERWGEDLQGQLTLLHGTSSVHVPTIRAEGLKNPYLTSSEDVADYYSFRTTDIDGGEPMVVEILIKDTSNLQVDFASYEEPILEVLDAWGLSDREWFEELGKSIPFPETDKHDWQTSLDTVMSVRYAGVIPPSDIIEIY